MATVVTIYEHSHYQGRSQQLAVGRYDLSQLTLGNDVLSSLRVPSGLRVTLFEHAGFTGRQQIFPSDTPYVGDDFDDRASSLIVEPMPGMQGIIPSRELREAEHGAPADISGEPARAP